MPAGYSGTPLGKKLGVKNGQRTWRKNMPESLAQEIADDGAAPVLLGAPEEGIDFVHIFETEYNVMAAELRRLRPLLAQNGTLWVSWPKAAAKRKTDIDGNAVRRAALPLGFVDIKVCAVDEIWSGLKLVIRKSERK